MSMSWGCSIKPQLALFSICMLRGFGVWVVFFAHHREDHTDLKH